VNRTEWILDLTTKVRESETRYMKQKMLAEHKANMLQQAINLHVLVFSYSLIGIGNGQKST